MDDYDLQQELEALGCNAFNADLNTNDTKPKAMSDKISQWQKLFEVSQDEAVDRIMGHPNKLTRSRISDAHWEMICLEKESEGYDRNTYGYELELQKKNAALPDLLLSG